MASYIRQHARLKEKPLQGQDMRHKALIRSNGNKCAAKFKLERQTGGFRLTVRVP